MSIWYVAFTLGFVGSLHCVGMCGPLAIAFCDHEKDTTSSRFFNGFTYNLGRTFTYSLMGLFFGVLGTFLVFVDMQKSLSIVLGIVLILTFFLSIDIDKKINGLPIMKRFYDKIRQRISEMYSKAKNYPPFLLGMANGLLPCGLVYLALAGALATGTLLGGMVFMAFFGFGTIPIMVVLVMGLQWVSPKMRMRFKQILPYVTLGFGIFLIYRGMVVDMPTELNFWEMLKNPILCH